MLNFFFFFFLMKSHKQGSLHWILKVHHTNKSQQFHSNQLKSSWDNWHRSFCFPALLWPCIYHHTKSESNWLANVQMHANAKVYWRNQQNNSYSPYFNKSYSKLTSGCSAWIASSPHQISSQLDGKCGRKWSQQISLRADHVTPRQGEGQWKWYKMIEVNGAYKHGWYEQIWLNSICEMLKILPFTTDGRSNEHDSLHKLDPWLW